MMNVAVAYEEAVDWFQQARVARRHIGEVIGMDTVSFSLHTQCSSLDSL